jgi:hypothetical protein
MTFRADLFQVVAGQPLCALEAHLRLSNLSKNRPKFNKASAIMSEIGIESNEVTL